MSDKHYTEKAGGNCCAGVTGSMFVSIPTFAGVIEYENPCNLMQVKEDLNLTLVAISHLKLK